MLCWFIEISGEAVWSIALALRVLCRFIEISGEADWSIALASRVLGWQTVLPAA